MSVKSSKGPIIDPGLCRCCGGLKKCRLLNVEYEHMGQKEVYSDIMMDCFGLLLSNLDGAVSQRLVCATCVVRLREASIFKQQVLNCEEALLLRLHAGEEEFKVKVELEVKSEEATENTANSPAGDAGDTLDDHGDLSSDDDASKDGCKLSEIRNEIRKQQLDESNQEVEKKKKKLVSKKSAVEQRQTKRNIMNRMNKLNNMLQQKLNKPATAPTPRRKPPAPPPPRMSRDRMAHDNTVLIVENSYVCPFRNRISNYYCFYCKEIFTDCIELRAHTLSHDPGTFESSMEGKRVPRIDVSRVDCRLCDAGVADVDAFKRHVTSVHNKIMHPVSDEFLKFRLTMDTLTCLECGGSFAFIDKLIDHMTEHFGKFVCDICGACFIEESSLCQHMRKHSRVHRDYPCHVCGNTLKSNYSRQLHIATVHEKRAVVGCYKCDASFLSYAQRNRHLINVHGDRRKFPCKSCDKVFDARKTMVEHTRKYHLQVCRHQCDVCEQRFYAPSQLREHLASHSGEREFRCAHCDKTFPRRQALREHMARHTSPPPPPPPHQCALCQTTFAEADALRAHMKRHQGFDVAGFDA